MHISIEAIADILKTHLDEYAIFQVIDESKNHKGHAGYNPDIGATHVAICIIWDGFEEVKLIDRHRLVNGWINGFFKQGLHAVRYSLKTQNENVPL